MLKKNIRRAIQVLGVGKDVLNKNPFEQGLRPTIVAVGPPNIKKCLYMKGNNQ